MPITDSTSCRISTEPAEDGGDAEESCHVGQAGVGRSAADGGSAPLERFTAGEQPLDVVAETLCLVDGGGEPADVADAALEAQQVEADRFQRGHRLRQPLLRTIARLTQVAGHGVALGMHLLGRRGAAVQRGLWIRPASRWR